SSDRLDFPINPSEVRVVVVSSISGGTGSGMSLDLGYAVRHALQRMGLVDAEVTGIFTHSLGSETRQSELAKVNAYSWLTELQHFCHKDRAYPGDAGAGLPGFSEGIAPFDHTYLLRWQDGMNGEEFQASVDSLAEYVYLNVFSPAQQFFDASRNFADEENKTLLRSFNLDRASAAESSLTEKLSASVSQQVVLNWSGGVAGCASQKKWTPSALASQGPEETVKDSSVSDTNQLVHGAAQFVSQSHLNFEGLSSATREVMKTRFEGKVERFYLKTLSTVEAAGTAIDVESAKRIADELFSDLNIENFENAVRIMGDPVQRVVGPLGLKLAGELRRWVLERLDDRQERLPGAKRAVVWLSDHFESVTRDAQRLLDRLGTQAAAETQELLGAPENRKKNQTISEPTLEKLLAYVRLRLDHASVLAARIISATLVAELKSLNETLVEFGRHLNHVAVAIHRNDEVGDDDSASLQPLDDWLDPGMKAVLPELADQVDEIVHEGYLAENGGLLETVMSNSRVRAGLLATIRERAREVACRQLQQQNLQERLTQSAGDKADSNKAASARLLDHGGSLRNLAVLPTQEPHGTSAENQGSAFTDETTVVNDPRTEFSLSCEAQEIPLVPVAVEIIDARRDYAEFAARVHTRKDINWQPLVAPAAAPSVPAWDSLCYNAEEEPSATQLV
ncbi:MAG: tubulin-like doman-containing protein, partial [Lacipirellulaceae bacterium]